MQKSRKSLIVQISFALYCLVMLWLLFARVHGAERSYNLTPLHTIRGYFDILRHYQIYGDGLRQYAIVNFAGNVFLFVPLGLFLPQLWAGERRFWIFLLTVMLAISFVEVMQYLTYTGAMDIDDLFLNTLGACLGFCLWHRKGPFSAKCRARSS